VSTRSARPRATSALSVAPATVTDRSCALVLGLEPRVFRALLTRFDIPCLHVGRRVVARVDAVLSAFDRVSTAAGTTAAYDEDPDQEGHHEVAAPEPALSADAILLRLGRVRNG
jgi:hypothetical protein